MEIKNSRPVLLGEIKDILERRKEKGDLFYEQRESLEHSEKFLTNVEKGKEKVEKLKDIDRINEELAIKLVNVSPIKQKTVEVILDKKSIKLDDDKIDEILEILGE